MSKQLNWMPFTKQLPQKGQHILFTECKFEDGFDVYVGDGVYYSSDEHTDDYHSLVIHNNPPEGLWDIYDSKNITGRKWHVTSSCIVAWLPFPDEYKGHDYLSKKCRSLADK